MSGEAGNGGPGGGGGANVGGAEASPRNRRSSITQAALSQLFNRGNSTNGAGGALNGAQNDPQRRRLSVTTLGLSGSLPNQPPSFNMRRSSISTNSDSIDESAIDDDDNNSGNKTAPNTPFTRRMSFGGQAMRGYRPGGGSPGNGNNNPTFPSQNYDRRRPSGAMAASQAARAASGRRASVAVPANSFTQASNTKLSSASSDNAMSRTDQQGFNWSEQLRSRAENSVSGARPSVSSISTSPPRTATHHDRAKSVSDMPQPPAQTPKPKQEPRKPDAFQERILKGDFYMD